MKSINFYTKLLFLVLCLPMLTIAQNKDLLTSEYFNLKSKQTEFKGKGVVKPDIIFLTGTQKIDDGKAKVRFIIEGKLSQLNFQIQPLHITRDYKGEILKTENVGEVSTMRLGIPNNETAKEMIANPEVTIPLEGEVNALQITLNFEKDNLGIRTLLVPLSDTFEVVGLRLFEPK